VTVRYKAVMRKEAVDRESMRSDCDAQMAVCLATFLTTAFASDTAVVGHDWFLQ